MDDLLFFVKLYAAPTAQVNSAPLYVMILSGVCR
jgi:hypothetical protein